MIKTVVFCDLCQKYIVDGRAFAQISNTVVEREFKHVADDDLCLCLPCSKDLVSFLGGSDES